MAFHPQSTTFSHLPTTTSQYVRYVGQIWCCGGCSTYYSIRFDCTPVCNEPGCYSSEMEKVLCGCGRPAEVEVTDFDDESITRVCTEGPGVVR